jgi:hypothetical protein
MTAATSPERRGNIARAAARLVRLPRAVAAGWVGGLLTVPGGVARDLGANVGRVVAVASTLPPRRAALFLLAACTAATVPILLALAALGVPWAMPSAALVAPVLAFGVSVAALHRGARRRAGSWRGAARELLREFNALRAAIAATVLRSTPRPNKDHLP